MHKENFIHKENKFFFCYKQILEKDHKKLDKAEKTGQIWQKMTQKGPWLALYYQVVLNIMQVQ